MDHKDFVGGKFIDNVDLIKMISGKQAKDFIKQHATDMMGPGAIIELFTDYFPNSYFDQLCWSFYVHFEHKAFYIRLMLNAQLPPAHESDTGSHVKIGLHNFENHIRNEFDHCIINRVKYTQFNIGLAMELGKNFPIEVVDNRREPNILERIFGVWAYR